MRYIDYTIWVDDHAQSKAKPDVLNMVKEIRGMNLVVPPIISEDKKKKPIAVVTPLDKFVMGLATEDNGCGYDEVDTWNYSGLDLEPSLDQIMTYSDEQTIIHNNTAVKKMKAPRGMINGLERVLADYKAVPRLGL